VPANTIDGFGPGDTIDLQGVASVTGVTLQGGSVLEVAFGSGDVALNLSVAPGDTTDSFSAWSDGDGGTDIGAVADQGTAAVPPATPVVLGVSGGVVNDGTVVITVGDPTITGTGPAGDLITLLNDGTVLAATTADADGSWSLQPSPTLTSGAYAIEAEATDDTGLVSALSSPLDLSVQSPQALSLDLPTSLVDSVTPILQQIFGSAWAPGDATNVTYEDVGGPEATPGPGVITALSVGDQNDNQTVIVPASVQIASNTADGPVTLVGGGSGQLFLSTSDSTTTFESDGGSGVYLANQAAGGDSSGANQIYIDSSASHVSGNYIVGIGSGNNVVQAQTGNDTIAAGPGSNSIFLGSGDDYVESTGTDMVSCSSLSGGGDTINAGSNGNNVEIFANAADLTFLGGPGSAAIIGGSVSMDVVGWAGSDTVWGSSGGGEYWGGQAGNSYLEAGTGSGACTLAGGNGNNNALFASNAANDVLVAGGGNETLGGGGATGNNQFFSGPGNTVIVAGHGDDTVSMTEGNSTVWAGANTLTFAYAPGYVVASAGQQTIIGGGPSETYLFESGLSGGSTVIDDFDPAMDHIDFWNYTLNDVNAALASQVNRGGNTAVTFSDHTRITFVGLQRLGSGSVSVL
jgi:hypothetical protein